MSDTINFGDTPTNDFEVLPEDRYQLECIEAKLTKSKAKKDKINAQFKVISGEYKNRRLFTDFTLVPKALFTLKSYFAAAGLETEGDIKKEEIPQKIINTQVSAFVTQEEWNKKLNNKIRNFAKVDSESESMFE